MKGDVCEKVEALGMNECFWRYMQWCRILSVVAPNWFAWFHSRLQVLNEAFEELNSWFSHVLNVCSCCIMKTQGRMTDTFDIPGLLFKSLIKCETHLENTWPELNLSNAKLARLNRQPIAIP